MPVRRAATDAFKSRGPLCAAMQAVKVRLGDETLHAEHHAPAGAGKGAVVLLHGLNSCIAEFGDLPQRLAAAGYHALPFDQRGFGLSDGERGRTSVARALEDCAAVTARLQTLAPGVPLVLLGHSLGGAYAVAALARPNPFACGVLAHPVDRLWDELNLVERAGYHVMGRVAERRMARGRHPGTVPYKVHYAQLFVSKEAAQAAQRPPFLLHRANLGNYRMALEGRASSWAPQVTVPVLTVWSPHDRVVAPANTRRVHEALAGPKEMLEHAGGHSCFRDLDGPRVATGIAAWLDRTLGAR